MLLSVGPYPDVTLIDARKRRDVARRQLRQGIAPSAEKQPEAKAASLADVYSFELVAHEWFEIRKCRWVGAIRTTSCARLSGTCPEAENRSTPPTTGPSV